MVEIMFSSENSSRKEDGSSRFCRLFSIFGLLLFVGVLGGYLMLRISSTNISSESLVVGHTDHLLGNIRNWINPSSSSISTTRSLSRGLARHRHHHHVDLEYNFSTDVLSERDVVVFVASTGKEGGRYIRDRIIPSSRTWMKELPNVYVMVEDTVDMRFQLRHCEVTEYKTFTSFTCHGEPTYVLSRACTDEYYNAAGICCKFDESINFLANENPELFASTKYFVQSDDDTFWRVDQLMRWLSSVEASGVSQYPWVANNGLSLTEEDMLSGDGRIWHIDGGCEEVKTDGWYQPIVLNHAALDRLRVGTKDFGVTQTCKEFDLSQDAGIGIYLWMYELNHIFMPGVEINPEHAGKRIFRPTEMAVHSVRQAKGTDCDGKNWPEKDRYDQDTVVGCGKIGHSEPFHDGVKGTADMYDAWDYFLHYGENLTLGVPGINNWIAIAQDEPLLYPNGYFRRNSYVRRNIEEIKKQNSPPVSSMKIVPYLTPLPGYNTTRHSEDYDLMEKFTPFTLKDCNHPGRIHHNRGRKLLRQRELLRQQRRQLQLLH